MTDYQTATASPSASARETKDRRADFILSLLRLASPNDPKKTDRQALAELRAALRGTPADLYRAARYVTPYLGEQAAPNDRWFYLIGGLLALHPKHIQGVSPGRAFGELRGDSGSVDARFLALLNTPANTLPKALRQMVALLQAKDIGLDYLYLLRDLCRWDDPDHVVQRRWARDFFRTGAGPENNAAEDAATTSTSTDNGDANE